MKNSDFLSFKGVKHFSPDMGWQHLSNALVQLQERVPPANDQQQLIPVLKDAIIQVEGWAGHDPLDMQWLHVASQVNQLTDCMNAQRLYREKLQALDKNVQELRESIKKNLDAMSQKMMSQP
jgi:hypothetical protein